jgi:hypothetical protein
MPQNILGALPPSTSPAGTLDKIDIMKTVRLALVVLAGTFVAATVQSITGHCDAAVTDYGDLSAVGDFKVLLGDAFQAGIVAVVSAGTELIRRLLVTP